MINNNKVYLFDDKDITDFSLWDIASRRFFKVINQELRMAQSNEQFYLMYQGNDLGVILLTEKQFKILKEINQENIKEMPYTP